MKKVLLLILTTSILVSRCDNKTKEENSFTPSATTSSTTTTTTTSTKTTSTAVTTKKVETTKKTTKKTTVKKTTTKKAEKNMYTSSYDKKKHKYSHVYKDKATCRDEGNEIFLDVSDNINKNVMVYNCEKVTDENGKTYYGLYFYTSTREDARYYY